MLATFNSDELRWCQLTIVSTWPLISSSLIPLYSRSNCLPESLMHDASSPYNSGIRWPCVSWVPLVLVIFAATLMSWKNRSWGSRLNQTYHLLLYYRNRWLTGSNITWIAICFKFIMRTRVRHVNSHYWILKSSSSGFWPVAWAHEAIIWARVGMFGLRTNTLYQGWPSPNGHVLQAFMDIIQVASFSPDTALLVVTRGWGEILKSFRKIRYTNEDVWGLAQPPSP